MSIQQIQIYKDHASSCTTMIHVPEENRLEELPNLFSTADDTLNVGYDEDGIEHDRTLCKVLQICRKENLKFNKDKCHFRCNGIPFLREIIFLHRGTTDSM